MASSPSPKTPPVKDLIKSAHQLWALACWATLRDAWSKRTELKGGLVLPPRVEAFFGWYCHRAYLRWIPAVEREILERPEKQKEYRQRKAEEEANERQKSSKTLQNARVAVDSDAGGAVRSEALEEGEEIAGIRISQ